MNTRDNVSGFEKLEFWALTAFFIFCCLPIGTEGYVGVLIRYVTVFLSGLYVNFRIVPALGRGEEVTKNIAILVGVSLLIAVVYFLTSRNVFGNYNLYTSDHGFWAFARQALKAILAVAGYLVVKRAALFLISKSETLQSFFIVVDREGLTVLGLWMILSYWVLIISVPTEVELVWLTAIPTGVLLQGIAFYYFIPGSLRGKYPVISYFFKVALFCAVTAFGVSVATMVAIDNEDRAFATGGFVGVVHMIFTSPALFLIYRWQSKKKEQIHALQGELGRSTANLDFLRSQINPHFLFNALNTIYGLAIQEKAERTSAAVEKLGDMMRFMLLENTQERISLKRELEYLDNYISLQRLRTDGNANLAIQIDIPGEINPLVRLTPMVLIPLVENAFKHGISLREQSYIKISLELRDTTLYFDVHNSTHQKMDNDPEKNSNGIGLANVRQRLQHVYPNRHELLVRQTSRDFFVHLRIELD